MPNIIADYPLMTDWLSNVLATLLELRVIKFNDIILHDKIGRGIKMEEEEKPMVEDYYRLIAKFLFILSK